MKTSHIIMESILESQENSPKPFTNGESVELDDLRSRNAGLINEIKTLKQMLDMESSAVKQMRMKLETEKNSRQYEQGELLEEAAELQYQITYKDRELVKHKTRVKALEDQVEELESQIVRLKKDRESLNAKSSKPCPNCSSLNDKIVTMTQKVEDLKINLIRQEELGQSMQDNLVETKISFDRLREMSVKETKDLRMTVRDLRSENNEVRAELQQMGGALTMMSRQLDRLTTTSPVRQSKKVLFVPPQEKNGPNERWKPHWKVMKK